MKKKKIIISSVLAGIAVLVGLIVAVVFIVKKNNEPFNFVEYYNKKIEIYAEENKTANNIDVAFIGDSITDHYDVKQYYPEINVLNRGICGDTTFGVENRLEVSLYDVNPKIVVMLIGINNLDTMLENYETLITKIQSNLPDTKLFIMSLLPNSKGLSYRNEQIVENNVVLQNLANTYGCKYINMYDKLLDETTNELNNSYNNDGLHPNAKGYEVMTEFLKPILLEELK